MSIFSFFKKNRPIEKVNLISPIKVSSIGDISELIISEDIPYAKAIERIRNELIGMGVTIDVADFYTEISKELHNFVNSITYRFIERCETKSIAYIIEGRDFHNCTYYEIDYSGKVLYSWSDEALNNKNKTKDESQGLKRVSETLGKYRQFM